jgi:hypothetical protein
MLVEGAPSAWAYPFDKGADMSKRQRGNKEPKKPKQERPLPVPVSASAGVMAALPVRLKRK